MGLLIKLAALVFFSLSSAPTFGQGSSAAAIYLKDTQGKTHAIRHFAGKLSIVHFWATWCSSCLTELPQLINVAEEMKEQGLSVIFIATDSLDATQQYMQKEKLQASILIDQYGKAMRDYQIQALPTSVFIDAKGNIIETQRGRIDWNSKVVRTRLQFLLAE